jgi:hypothetical protein
MPLKGLVVTGSPCINSGPARQCQYQTPHTEHLAYFTYTILEMPTLAVSIDQSKSCTRFQTKLLNVEGSPE